MEVEMMESLLNKSKPEVAALIRTNCIHSENDQLKLILDNLLSPSNDIDDDGVIDWLIWLIAGGSTPEEFKSTVRLYDKATTCNLVWTENFVAYRCRTCGISPCMSLCAECFQHGNHEGHDFIVFRSETGGACDCGSKNIIKESQLNNCSLHGPQRAHKTQNPAARSSRSESNSSSNEQSAPPELFCIANGMMARMLYKLVLTMRDEHRKKCVNPIGMPKIPVCKHNNNNNNVLTNNLAKGHKFIRMLQGLSDMGIAMRQVMIHNLTNSHAYLSVCEAERSNGNRSRPECKTFLEEFVYWTVKFEFPEDLVCLLLSMRSDTAYKEAFTKAFVIHYKLISETILKSLDPEKLCKHVAAVSVQLFSNAHLAITMVNQMGLLNLLILNLYEVIQSAVVRKKLDNGTEIVSLDCDHEIMKNNYYWPIKSDLKELISHFPVAVNFFDDQNLLDLWFEFLSLFQGMNSVRFIEKGQPHIEQESEIHIGAFTAELEISATPMWTLLSHLKDKSTAGFTKNIVSHCWRKLRNWIEKNTFDQREISFHLPLHRNLSMFIHQGVNYQNLSLQELLPPSEDVKPIVRQLIRLQSKFFQISGRLWSRNGAEVQNQAESYVNSLCCNSMIDSDIFFLQATTGSISHEEFMEIVFEEFHINEIFYTDTKPVNQGWNWDQEEQKTIIESFLLFLATLATNRTNLGLPEEKLMALEMSTLLCVGDKLHSELMELLPERCGSDSQLKNFESVLSQVADYQAPRNMQQGKYVPQGLVWDSLYDPIHALLRSSSRADFQSSLDRFEKHVKRSSKFNSSQTPWPPFRIPVNDTGPFPDPKNILSSKALYQVLFLILHQAVNTSRFSNFTVSLVIYLLELSITSCKTENELVVAFSTERQMTKEGKDSHGSSGESLISLLLKLHVQFRGFPMLISLSKPVMDLTMKDAPEDNCIGDGSHFLKKVIAKLISKSETLRDIIMQNVQVPESASEECYDKEREEKRRKAKERKLQLMSEFAMKRQQFMKEMKDDLIEVDKGHNHRQESADRQYECVICKEKGASKPENPFGLITFVTPSSLLSHRRLKEPKFTVSEGDYRSNFAKFSQEYSKYFEDSSVKLSIPMDCGLGTCVQTCGHHIHTDCFTSYMNSLRKPRSSSSAFHGSHDMIQLNYKTFCCPLCRQVANSFLPILLDSLSSSSYEPQSPINPCDLSRLLKKRNTLVLSPKQKQGVEIFLADINKTVAFARSGSVSLNVSADIICSVFFHALEMEQERAIHSSGHSGRSCLSPLYSVLRYSYKSLSAGHSRKLAQCWEVVCGVKATKSPRDVPLLLRDLNLLFSHLVLHLPYGTECELLDIIVAKLCNLRLIQALCGLCFQMDLDDLKQIKLKYQTMQPETSHGSLAKTLLVVIESLEKSHGTRFASSSSSDVELLSSSPLKDPSSLTIFVETVMKAFLRKVGLLRRFMSCESFEKVQTPTEEARSSKSSSPKCTTNELENVSGYLRIVYDSVNTDATIPMWVSELTMSSSTLQKLFLPHILHWEQPKLIDVASEYDRIFQKYRKIKCQNCNVTPSEPALCLACGQILCLNSFCCFNKQSKLSEVIQHSIDCGMGTSVFLCVLSSAVLVVVGSEACVWGSIFLDSFGEEDLDLKRGKPLFLCKDRLAFLQRQWSSNSFLKSEMKWFPHDNML